MSDNKPDSVGATHSEAKFVSRSHVIFIFYLILFGNYLGDTLFTNRLNRVFTQNRMLKHLIAYLTLTLTVILTEREESGESLFGIFREGAIIYLWFLVSTKVPLRFSLSALVALLLSFIISSARQITDIKIGEYRVSRYRLASFLSITAMVIIIIGLFTYFDEKRVKFGTDFNIGQFIFG